MAKERCTEEVHRLDPNMRKYDWTYYNELLPYVKGEVLDIGCGAGMFAKEYAKKPEVTSVLGIDKYVEEMPTDVDKITCQQFDIPDELGYSEDSAKFDTIVSTEFVEHIPREKLEPLLDFVRNSLKDGGLFIGSTPNKKVPTTNPYHLYEYTLTELLSIYRGFFSEVEAYDNGQNCTVWIAKK